VRKPCIDQLMFAFCLEDSVLGVPHVECFVTRCEVKEYVLGSNTSIFDGIPPENPLAMLKAAEKYGHGSKGGLR